MAARDQDLRQRTLINVVGAAMQELRGASSPQEADLAAPTSARSLMVGALQLDTWRQEATLAGRTLALTPTEFRVLLCLAEHAGTMLPYAQLVRSAQGYDTGELEAGELIKPHIHHLRQKLEPELQRTALHLKRPWEGVPARTAWWIAAPFDDSRPGTCATAMGRRDVPRLPIALPR